MREIKFRAWFHAKEPVYRRGIQVNTDKMLQVGDDSGTEHPLDCCNYARLGQPIILMQYTGLKDSKGKEVYEGDLLRYATSPIYTVSFSNGEFVMAGESINGGFQRSLRNDITSFMEVIGNIYENPELLSKGQ